jgi:hypothetical protein
MEGCLPGAEPRSARPVNQPARLGSDNRAVWYAVCRIGLRGGRVFYKFELLCLLQSRGLGRCDQRAPAGHEIVEDLLQEDIRQMEWFKKERKRYSDEK